LVSIHISTNSFDHFFSSFTNSFENNFYFRGVQRMEAMLFAVDKINNDTNLLNNITLGVNIQVIYFEKKIQKNMILKKHFFVQFYLKLLL